MRTLAAALPLALVALLSLAGTSIAATVSSEPDGASRRLLYNGTNGAEAFVYAKTDGAYLFQTFLRGSPAATGTPIAALDVWCENHSATTLGCDDHVASFAARGYGGDDWLQLGSPPGAAIFETPSLLDGGDGNDFLEAGAGNDTLMGGAGDDILSDFPGDDTDLGGPGQDAIYPGDGNDTIDGGEGIDRVDYYAWGDGFDMTTGRVVDKVTGATDTLHGIENLFGSNQPDTISGDDEPNQLVGIGGADTISGGGGPDRIDAGAGDDVVQARDGVVDFLDCGPGNDRATVDTIDNVSGCEAVDASAALVPDADGDGSAKPGDCDDANPAVHPGAPDIPENGIDEDCNGRDGQILDRDRDGYPRPLDCDDTRASVHPGAVDVPGNPTDEDCHDGPQPYPPLESSVGFTAYFRGSSTRFTELFVRHARVGSTVRVRCRGHGCPFRVRTRSVRRDAARLDLWRPFRAARLWPRSRLEVRITSPRTIGVLTRITVRRGALPLRRELCLRPGSSRPRRCTR